MKRARLLLLLAALPLLASCAYWNTYYLAKKNYDRGAHGEPYLIDTQDAGNPQDFTNTIKFAKKLLSQYPKSKWVDAAYLLWARALIARQDPLQAANMLGDFSTRFPQSQLKADASFYLGVAYRQSHKPTEAITALDDFLAHSPKNPLVPYALLERSRALVALDRRREAAETAGILITRYPKSTLVHPARIARSEALLADGEFTQARDDFRELGLDATSDEERFGFLLREADCLEGAREFDAEIELLKRALTHELTPILTTQTTASGTQVVTASTGPGLDHWGRLRLRIGTAHMLAGRLDPALEEYREVLANYPHLPLAAEAQFRLGYAYEMLAGDFEKARTEYGKMKDQTTVGGFSQQATTRLAALDRLATYGQASGRDSLARKAEAGFLLAELFLFQHAHPEKALEQYRKIEQDFKGTPWAGKAINAQAWLLSRRMDRKAEADSLFWRVVHEYRATEAQLAARDYLEADGIPVADSLIEQPRFLIEAPRVEPDTLRLPRPPAVTPRLGETLVSPPGRALPDSMRFAFPPRPRLEYPDTLARGSTPLDTLRRAAPGDTTQRHP